MGDFRGKYRAGRSNQPTDRSHDGEQASRTGSSSHRRRPLFSGDSHVRLPPDSALGRLQQTAADWGASQMQGEIQDSSSDIEEQLLDNWRKKQKKDISDTINHPGRLLEASQMQGEIQDSSSDPEEEALNKWREKQRNLISDAIKDQESISRQQGVLNRGETSPPEKRQRPSDDETTEPTAKKPKLQEQSPQSDTTHTQESGFDYAQDTQAAGSPHFSPDSPLVALEVTTSDQGPEILQAPEAPEAGPSRQHGNPDSSLTIADDTAFEAILSNITYQKAKNAFTVLNSLNKGIKGTRRLKDDFTMPEDYVENVYKSARTLKSFSYARDKEKNLTITEDVKKAINTLINEIPLMQNILVKSSNPLETLFVALTENIPESTVQSLRDKGKARAIEHRSSPVEEIDEITLNKINDLDDEKIESLFKTVRNRVKNLEYMNPYIHLTYLNGYKNWGSEDQKEKKLNGKLYTKEKLKIIVCDSYRKLGEIYEKTKNGTLKQLIKDAGFDFAQPKTQST